MGDIIIERGEQPGIMKLDADEEAFLNEIEITDEPAPKRARAPQRRPARPPMRRPTPSEAMPEIDAFTNPTKVQAPRRAAPEVVEYADEEEEEEEYGYAESEVQEMGDVPSPGFATVDDEKADLLNKLNRLEKKGFQTSKRYTAYSSVDELRMEVKRIMYSIYYFFIC